MSLVVERERQAWEAYFNASKGVATNGVTGIFRKTCRVFVWEHSQCGRGLHPDGGASVTDVL